MRRIQPEGRAPLQRAAETTTFGRRVPGASGPLEDRGAWEVVAFKKEGS